MASDLQAYWSTTSTSPLYCARAMGLQTGLPRPLRLPAGPRPLEFVGHIYARLGGGALSDTATRPSVYTLIIIIIIIIISFSSPTLSFIPDLKPSLFLRILPTAAFLFLLQD